MLAKKFKFEDEEETFYNFIESKKWKGRGAALDALNKALGLDTTKLPDSTEALPALKLAPGDYAPFAKALTTCIKKDTNVLLLIKAFTSVSVISHGLRDKFKNYASLPRLPLPRSWAGSRRKRRPLSPRRGWRRIHA